MKEILFYIRDWYFYHIKYMRYNKKERQFLCTFEQGIRARQSCDSMVHDMLRMNIERAKCLFDDDYVRIKDVDKSIGELATEFEETMKFLEEADKQIWQKLFTYFLMGHDDTTVSDVFGTQTDIVKNLRENGGLRQKSPVNKK